MSRVLIIGLLLASCTASERPRETTSATPPDLAGLDRVASAPTIFGKWLLISVNGQPAANGRDGRSPRLGFSTGGAGGYVGCNSFGGIGLSHEGRWYGGFVTSTAMACGEPFDTQERLVQGILASGPRIAWSGENSVELIAPQTRIALRREAPSDITSDPEPVALLGSRWSFGAIDGRALDLPGARSGPVLVLEGDRFTFTTPCVVREGRWSQEAAGLIRFTPDGDRATPCAASAQPQSRAFTQALSGPKRFVTGPNREILLAGGGHWLVGDGVRVGTADSDFLVGRWRREDAEPDPSADDARNAELILTRRGYSLWDGCNRTEGLAIPFDRQLILRSSGLSTLASCPQRVDQQFKSVVTSNPRIGLLPGGGLLLSSPAGDLRLRKVGTIDGNMGGIRRTLGHPMRFTLLGHGGGTLEFTGPGRYRLTTACGVTDGRWRAAPRESEGSIRFGPDREPEGCRAPGADRNLGNIFRGNVEVAIGPNRDIALFVSRFGHVSARLEP